LSASVHAQRQQHPHEFTALSSERQQPDTEPNTEPNAEPGADPCENTAHTGTIGAGRSNRTLP
jgi:hypothetical protein